MSQCELRSRDALGSDRSEKWRRENEAKREWAIARPYSREGGKEEEEEQKRLLKW